MFKYFLTTAALYTEDAGHNNMELTPLEMYERRVTSGEFRRDSHQIMIVEELQKLHGKLTSYEPTPVKEPGFISKVGHFLIEPTSCFDRLIKIDVC